MTTREEVSRHASGADCWIIIRGSAYDVTNFLDHHPGGRKVILDHAGRDATEAFEAVHSIHLLGKHLKASQRVGQVEDAQATRSTAAEQKEEAQRRHRLLAEVISIPDFESAAAQVLAPKSFAFFKAGADSENTANWNQRSWSAVRFRPRVLVPIQHVDISTSILGTEFSAPFFIAPAGGGKFANSHGEILMTKAAARHGILQWVCNNAGCAQREMTSARGPNQTLFWQIYAMKDLEITKLEIEQAIAAGYKGFALTVDAVQVGKRERDMRLNIAESHLHGKDGDEVDQANSISSTRPSCYDQFDFFSAVKWLRSITDLPIAIKGIQCWEDAALCMHHGVHPWLSNHGGRQLEGSPASIETLLEIRTHCPEVLERCDIIVDGGVTRGTDIVKALALGAKGVALGRAFLYALAFGEPGVSKAISILKRETETAMGLVGVSSIDQLRPSHVDASSLMYAGLLRAQL
ncbi:oxidoreductase [Plectosphaerella cucumerina]|uniref:Oxidoreductase n=1 Tax=Plectosphaerella cucumerina TaxID=40658 RepID=A0A8K0X3K6_9PEZI|nr:oxidoreductase [Plectosphaerella cucumerina]